MICDVGVRKTLLCSSIAVALLGGCAEPAASDGEGSQLAGAIRIDGSSTVYPISQAAAEYFGERHPRVRLSVSRSGTTAGMDKFLLGEADVCSASRRMTVAERAKAETRGKQILEFVVAMDGLAIVANPDNDWCDVVTVEQLKAIWRPEAEGEITHWSQLDARWADVPLRLFGPGTASGTFEYFTTAICGEKKASRSDYQRSEDDNMLVRGVAGERGGMAYFGLAYYLENRDQLKLLAVDAGNGPVSPSEETVRDGRYVPLSRPLYLYVSQAALARAEVAAFVRTYVENSSDFATQCQYVSVSDDQRRRNQELLATALP